ncbi:MAG: hypothetical protein HC764_27140 [Pleurocapsa sp. CRU_1_2]|nr:hypothetical protein [Pleurocapsa sp. CRU_1_2]
MTNLTPALWIGNSGITSLGNLTIGNGNVVISDPAVVTGTTRDGCRNFSDANTSDGSANLASTITFPTPPTTTPPTPQGTVISDNRNLPSIQKLLTASMKLLARQWATELMMIFLQPVEEQ